MSPHAHGRHPLGQRRVAAIIAAHNVGHDVATTVRSCRAIPGLDLIVVVDDGSDDDTGHQARLAGAVVVRHSVPRGRASARETGVKVAAMRDRADGPQRLLLFLSADVGESAVEASTLVEAVMGGDVDCAVAAPVPEEGQRRSLAANLATAAIRRATGWESRAPLSEMRCFTRDALNTAMPFANGYGLEVGMTIDMLSAGMSMAELPCSFTHSGADETVGYLNRKQRYADVLWTIANRRLRRVHLPVAQRREAARQQVEGRPYPRPASVRDAEPLFEESQ